MNSKVFPCYIFILFIFIGCMERNCLPNTIYWDNAAPLVYIKSKFDHPCEYLILATFNLDDTTIFLGEGRLKIEKNVWYLSFSDPIIPNYFKILKFQRTQPEVYNWMLKYKDQNGTLRSIERECSLIFDQVIDKEEILGIKVLDSHVFGRTRLDMVLFFSSKRGIVGSYLTGFDWEKKVIIGAERGDILREYIDYSKYRKVKFQ